MTPDPVERPYTLRSMQQMLGLSRRVLSGLIAAGFVRPTRGPRNEYRFSFQDAVLLRTAHGLQAAHIPPRKILRSLQRLRASLPPALPMSGLRITAVGKGIAVREGHTQWEAESGQLLMDFQVAPRRGEVAFLQPAAPPAAGPAAAAAKGGADADGWFARGQAAEQADPHGAESAYRHALALDPAHANAYLNLGALLCEAGRCDEAAELYARAVASCPKEAALHFNQAIALEDLGRLEDALASYERCLRLAPGLADAHYNAARLHEQLGHAQKALRHYSAYRRLER